MKTLKFTAGFILSMALLMTAGCYKPWHQVEGNGDVITETRDFSDFEKVYNEGNFEVYIIQDGLSEVEIEAESNLIPLIRTKIEGSALVIDTQDDLRNNEPMKIYVHIDEVRALRVSGSGMIETENLTTGDLDLEISGSGELYYTGTSADVDANISGSGSMEIDLTCEHLECDISGSGDIEAKGTANDGDFRISGSGSIRAYDLLLQECQASISGSGSMYVNVADYLDVNISGSGNVYYMGNPIIETTISGSGSVIHP